MNILLVEDDPEVSEMVTMAFAMRWPQASVQVARSGAEGVKTVTQNAPDLVILDVGLPDQDGFTVLDSIRSASPVPVIMLTGRATDRDKVRGLEMGADDYVAKPFSPFELLARAAAVLRRSGGTGNSSGGVMQAGPIRLNLYTAEAFVRDQVVKLSPTEFKMLILLVQQAGKVVSRDALIKEVWGTEPSIADAHRIKLHIQHLRQKLGDKGTEPELIITVRGFGYKVPA